MLSICCARTRRLARVVSYTQVLINNAAQTLTRQKGWNLRMAELEQAAALSSEMLRVRRRRL